MGIAMLARQPIFDAQTRVQAYELFYREPLVSNARIQDGDSATATVAVNALMEINLEKVAGQLPIHMNLSRSFMVNDLYKALPQGRVVLEVAEESAPDGKLMDALRRARGMGFKLALDNYKQGERRTPLLDLVDLVKIDVSGITAGAIAEYARALRRPGRTLAASKIETHEAFTSCREAGLDLYQGWFFAQPDLLQRRTLTADHAALMQVLAAIGNPGTEMDQIAEAIERDAALSYKVLNYVNSALFGLSTRIESIRHACKMLGRERLRACAMLLVLAGLAGKTRELTLEALIRARMCRMLAPPSPSGTPDKYFTIGLLSLIDAFFDRPLHEVLAELHLADDVVAALKSQDGPAGNTLRSVIACERGEWDALRLSPVAAEELQQRYNEAIAWAEEFERAIPRPAA